jgi:cysteine desulfurase
MQRIYLDNNATTGVDPRVLEAMLPELSSIPANPSSIHFFGQEARNKLLKARQLVAGYLGVRAQEIIFTSGGTESLNILLRQGVGHVITSNAEHSAVYNTLQSLKNEVSYLEAGSWGAVLPEQVKRAIQPNTRLIVLFAVNAETGVKTDIEAIGKIAQEANIPFIVDGVALLGKEPFVMHEGVSGMAFSGHKLHAPKGVGLAFIRSSFKVTPLLTGGDQESTRRAGTENLAGIIGLAKAIELLQTELPFATERMRNLRDHFEKELQLKLGGVQINGEGPRVVNTSNLSFTGVDGETLLLSLDMAGISASHGSACASGALEPSRILSMMGFSKDRARSSLRFTLSRWTTLEEIERAIHIISEYVTKLRR